MSITIVLETLYLCFIQDQGRSTKLQRPWKSVELIVAGSWSICVCPTQKAFSTDQNQKSLTVLDRDLILSVTWVQTSLSLVWISSLWGNY